MMSAWEILHVLVSVSSWRAEEILNLPKIRILAPSLECGLELSDVGR
jgi:hypothetical protein